jgi:urease gamma subunit
LRLNYPEARALIADEICEGARDGKSVAELMGLGASILTADDVLPGVARLVGTLQVEAMLPDGQKLVTIHDPIAPGAAPVEPGEIGAGRATSSSTRGALVRAGKSDGNLAVIEGILPPPSRCREQRRC